MLGLTLAFNKPLTRWMRQFKAAELMTKESMSSFDLSFDMLSQIQVEEEEHQQSEMHDKKSEEERNRLEMQKNKS